VRIEFLAPAMACSRREPRRRAAVGALSMRQGSSRCASGQPTRCSRHGSSDRDAASFFHPMLARRADRALQMSQVTQTISMCEDSRPWRLEARQFDMLSRQTAPSLRPCSLANFVSVLTGVRVDQWPARVPNLFTRYCRVVRPMWDLARHAQDDQQFHMLRSQIFL
jgi:hypothetical protein